VENFPRYHPHPQFCTSLVQYIVLLIWLLASAAKSGLRGPINALLHGAQQPRKIALLLGLHLPVIGQHINSICSGYLAHTETRMNQGRQGNHIALSPEFSS
jgi:hypothetical protein